MTRANEIKSALNHGTHTFDELLIEADETGDAYEQDFDNETTHFEFSDGSVALFLGVERDIRVYGAK